MKALLALHPAPWRVEEDYDDRVSDLAPLTIIDANGLAVMAIAGHAPVGQPANEDDYVVANAVLAWANFAGLVTP